MQWNDLQRHFSASRLERYLNYHQGNKSNATEDYALNMVLAESMMPLLNVLEISLRNGIHRKLTKFYNRPDWWEEWLIKPDFAWQNTQVKSAKTALKKRNEKQTSDKVVAELTFGFWSSLFNAALQKELWKSLRLVFPKCPKEQRKRKEVARALNKVRNLRNRAFHHESLLWLNPSLDEQHEVGMQVIYWIDPNLAKWIARYDRFPSLWSKKVN